MKWSFGSSVVLIVCLHGALGCRLERDALAPHLDGDEERARQQDDDSAAGDGAERHGPVPTFADASLAGSGAAGASAEADAGSSPLEDGAKDETRDARAVAEQDAAPDAGEQCTAPVVAVCDPVTNSGCAPELQMQCAVDLAAPLLSGYCSFSVPADPALCINTLVTESCPPTSTCVGGACRKLCFCDAHCDGGRCCAEPLGNLGFRVCGACSEP